MPCGLRDGIALHCRPHGVGPPLRPLHGTGSGDDDRALRPAAPVVPSADRYQGSSLPSYA